MALSANLITFLLSSIPGERWFVSKSRSIRNITIVSDVPFISGKYHIMIVRIDMDSSSDYYNLFIKKESSGKYGNALEDREFVSALLEGFIAPDHVDIEKTGILMERVLPLSLKSTTGLSVSLNGEEQTNSTVFLGNTLAIKFYRRLTPYDSPDYEVPKRLSSETSFTGTPKCFGSMQYNFNGNRYLLCSIFQYIENEGSCWSWFTGRLAALSSSSSLRMDSLAEEIRNIGRITSELHNSLKAVTDGEEYVGDQEMERWLAEFSSNLHSLYSTRLSGDLPTMDRVMDIAKSKIYRSKNSPFLKIRIHGDYHLGQIIKGKDAYYVIDFEGEPLRSLDYRKRPSTVLKDVAGMLRSFHYAISYSCRMTNLDPLGDIALSWYLCARDTFLKTYMENIAREAPLIPSDRDAFLSLLDFFIVDKAVYETLYEINNRPDWVQIPLHAILSIVNDHV